MKAPNKTSASLVDVVYYNIIVQSVLDLSKVLIYEFYYEYVIPKVGKKMVTLSIWIQIQTVSYH